MPFVKSFELRYNFGLVLPQANAFISMEYFFFLNITSSFY